MIEFLIGLAIIAVYFMPSLLANHRKHKNQTPIILVNMVLGWTLIMWFVCLVWATTSNVKDVE